MIPIMWSNSRISIAKIDFKTFTYGWASSGIFEFILGWLVFELATFWCQIHGHGSSRKKVAAIKTAKNGFYGGWNCVEKEKQKLREKANCDKTSGLTTWRGLIHIIYFDKNILHREGSLSNERIFNLECMSPKPIDGQAFLAEQRFCQMSQFEWW